MKNNSRFRKNFSESDFYNYLAILNNIITDYKKNHCPAIPNTSDIYYFNNNYLSGDNRAHAIRVYNLIKWISNEDFDKIFDFYDNLLAEEKLNFVKLLRRLIKYPIFVKFASRSRHKKAIL